MLGSPVLYLMGMRITMFQLSGFYYRDPQSPSYLSKPSDLTYSLQGARLGWPRVANPKIADSFLQFRV